MDKILIEPYNRIFETDWNRFVLESRNGTFLFDRGYMEYHADRFKDLSLIVRNAKGKIVALFAAATGLNDQTTVTAHPGLTYGGLILPYSVSAVEIGEIISSILNHYRDLGYKKLVYKPVPHIYHKFPTEEDIYFLIQKGAKTTECRLSSTISFNRSLMTNENTRRNIKRAANENLRYFLATKNEDWAIFHEILSSTLASRHDARPVHSFDEIWRLHSRFPENIQLWLVATPEDNPLAGIILYITDTVVHSQYIASSTEGFEKRALAGLINHLLEYFSGSGKYFDFGTSNECHGRILNEGLIRQKSGFGARGTVDLTLSLEL